MLEVWHALGFACGIGFQSCLGGNDRIGILSHGCADRTLHGFDEQLLLLRQDRADVQNELVLA